MKHGLKVFVEHYKSKEHWYIKYITWSIIGIVCFAILVQIFKELGFPPAQKVFDFLNQWAMVLSAGATFLLAGTAFWAIMDNRHSRVLDKRERLLNEIIKWAEDITKSALRRRTMEQLADFWSTKMEYSLSEVKSSYIRELVSLFFKDLSRSLNDVVEKLENAIVVITKYIDNRQASLRDLRNTEDDLVESVRKLLIEVAKIKTRDIS